jgi:hypothetical protein
MAIKVIGRGGRQGDQIDAELTKLATEIEVLGEVPVVIDPYAEYTPL